MKLDALLRMLFPVSNFNSPVSSWNVTRRLSRLSSPALSQFLSKEIGGNMEFILVSLLL